jgi:hypothetical protein
MTPDDNARNEPKDMLREDERCADADLLKTRLREAREQIVADESVYRAWRLRAQGAEAKLAKAVQMLRNALEALRWASGAFGPHDSTDGVPEWQLLAARVEADLRDLEETP